MILNTLCAVALGLIVTTIWSPPLWVAYLAIAIMWAGLDAPVYYIKTRNRNKKK